MNPAVAYLVEFLEDELKDVPGVRVRPVQPSTTRRAPDLEQNYDSENNRLHLRHGAMVQWRGRQEYFPAEWVTQKDFEAIRELARKIKGE